MFHLSGIVDGILISNGTGWAILAIQGIFGIVMVAAIFTKYSRLKKVQIASRRFRRDFNTGDNVIAYYMQHRRDSGSPLEAIYRRACERLLKLLSYDSRNKMFEGERIPEGSALSPREIALVDSSCGQELANQESSLSFGLGAIATIVSLEPMLGLLGTVWGVLDAFGDMEPGSAMLAKLAPSISSALATTVLGLLVAIPGLICNNFVSSGVAEMNSEMEKFADELTGRIACEFQGGEK